MIEKKSDNNFGFQISRRNTLKLLSAAGAAILINRRGERLINIITGNRLPASVDAATSSCIVRPKLTEGPFFVDELLNRADITSDPKTGKVSAGMPLTLKFNITDHDRDCSPLVGAYVDIWHCNADGLYSDVGGGMQESTKGQQFLRGYQVTDNNGSVTFQTVFPGWYQGRTVHIHFMIRLYNGDTETFEFTSQLFFDDKFSDQIFKTAPYNKRGEREERNSSDGIYQESQGKLLLAPAKTAKGYQASIDIGLTGLPGGKKLKQG